MEMNEERYEEYEDAMLQCAKLLARAKQVDSEENRKAVRAVAPFLHISGLEMKWVEHGRMLYTVRFFMQRDADLSRAKEYCYEEYEDACAVYTLYPARGEKPWDERMLRRIEIFMVQLHLMNERQTLKRGDADFCLRGADVDGHKKFYESAFERALANEEIRVFFQPKVSLKDYDLIGAEALSRWVMNGEIIPPNSFIPVLEETTRICELDFYVLEHVCAAIRDWMHHNMKPVKVSVNFSRRHLSNEHLVDDIVEVIDRYGVPHGYIEIELTETMAGTDLTALKRIVHGLRQQGIVSSVDDFGMGYSSLSLIRDVPFKILKIDRSFLGDKKSGPDERKRAMMKHVIRMANDLGMECIAEGVESMEHVQLLKESKCYMAQGFLFNRPVPKEEFEHILTQAG